MPAPRSARTPSSRSRASAGAGGPRPPLTPEQARRLQALLDARAAAAGRSPGGSSAAPSVRPRPGSGRSSSGRSSSARSSSGRSSSARSSSARSTSARRRKRRGSAGPSFPQAWRTFFAGRLGADRARWQRRAAVIALGVLLPLLAGMLSPTAPTPATASSAGNDPAGLAASAAQDLAADAARYRALQSDLVGLRDDLDRAAAAEDQARTAQVTAQAAVGDAAAELYRSTPEQQTPLLILDRNDPDAAATVIGLQVLADRADADRTAVVVRAERAGQAVTAAATRTAAAQLAVDSGVAEAQTVLTRIRATVAGLTPATSAQLASFGAVPSAADQQARNADALRRWQEYLATLDAAQIQPPAAAALADPDDLPPGFSPALDSSGAAIPGVAWAIADSRPVTVLPAETVVAVSVAFAALGRPYQADTAGPEAYDCGGLVAASWLQAGFGLPSVPVDQWTGGTAVPTAQLQVGDLVFADGGNDVAIYVGEGQVLGASGAAYQVGIRPLTASAGSVRVTLPGSGQPNPALPATNSGNGRCGTPPAPVGPVSPAWGGFANGRIPAAALCPIAPGHALRCDAAAQYTALAAAFAADFGRPLCITDSYRSYAAQLTASRVKPRLAAVPGTSNHGWALAVDLCGGINHAGSAEYRWMEAHAGRYGFVHPDWAQPGAEKPEPWHWEFGHLLDS